MKEEKVMKKLAIMMLALSASLLAADYSGIYSGKGVIQSSRYPGGVPYTMQLTLVQAGTSLTGTMKIANGTPLAISGTISGASISFATAGASQQSTAILTANGSVLTGSMTRSTGQVYQLALNKN
jgi:hypothetical protein